MAKTIEKYMELLDINREQAALVRGLMTGDIDPASFKPVADWLRECYNPPRNYEMVMEALNVIIGGYGVEGFQKGDIDDWVTYINTGDTYAPTVVYYDGQYHYTSWGDVAEKFDI